MADFFILSEQSESKDLTPVEGDPSAALGIKDSEAIHGA